MPCRSISCRLLSWLVVALSSLSLWSFNQQQKQGQRKIRLGTYKAGKVHEVLQLGKFKFQEHSKLVKDQCRGINKREGTRGRQSIFICVFLFFYLGWEGVTNCTKPLLEIARTRLPLDIPWCNLCPRHGPSFVSTHRHATSDEQHTQIDALVIPPPLQRSYHDIKQGKEYL